MKGIHRFRPHERLHASGEYQHVKQVGKRLRARHFGVNTAVNRLPHHRLGLVVQKRFWHAVERSRIKRCVREWFRLHKHLLPLPGLDIVIIARQGVEKLSYRDMAKELLGAFAIQDDPNP